MGESVFLHQEVRWRTRMVPPAKRLRLMGDMDYL